MKKVLKYMAYGLLAIVLTPFILTLIGIILATGFALSMTIYVGTIILLVQLFGG